MPNQPISGLNAASSVQASDLFALEQNGVAMKLTGQILENWLLSFGAGMGGIQSIAKTSSTGTNPVVDTYTITYTDTSTSTFTVTNGVKGDTGQAWYVWIKYASQQPTQDSDMGNVPDEWMGIYSGTASSAPAHYTDYDWYKIKGNVGTPSSLVSSVVEYQSGSTGTVVPSGTWSSTPPVVSQGDWLWTQTTLTFNTGSPVVLYTASRQGVDGEGAAGTSLPLVDSSSGAVGSAQSFSREDHQHPVPVLHITSTISTLPTTISNANILSTMRVINCELGSPKNVTSDIAWSTSDGSIALSGTMVASTTTTIDLDLAIF